MLATASDDTESNVVGEKPVKGSTRIWDLATGVERQRLAVEGCNVRSVAFSPDGRLLAASSSDESLRLYDLTTGQERVHEAAKPHERAVNRSQPPPVWPAVLGARSSGRSRRLMLGLGR